MQDAIKNIENIINEEKIDCDFERVDNYIFTQDQDYVERIKDEVEAVNSLGLNAIKLRSKTRLSMTISHSLIDLQRFTISLNLASSFALLTCKRTC